MAVYRGIVVRISEDDLLSQLAQICILVLHEVVSAVTCTRISVLCKKQVMSF